MPSPTIRTAVITDSHRAPLSPTKRPAPISNGSPDEPPAPLIAEPSRCTSCTCDQYGAAMELKGRVQ